MISYGSCKCPTDVRKCPINYRNHQHMKVADTPEGQGRPKKFPFTCSLNMSSFTHCTRNKMLYSYRKNVPTVLVKRVPFFLSA